MSEFSFAVLAGEAGLPYTQSGTPTSGRVTISLFNPMPLKEPAHTVALRFRNSSATRPESSLHLASTQTSSSVASSPEQQFNKLADQWERETRNMSSIADIINHSSYKAIVAMGMPALKFILRRMKTRPAFWFDALRQLTQKIDPVDPIHPHMYGDLKQMTEAWLRWGNEHVDIIKATSI